MEAQRSCYTKRVSEVWVVTEMTCWRSQGLRYMPRSTTYEDGTSAVVNKAGRMEPPKSIHTRRESTGFGVDLAGF